VYTTKELELLKLHMEDQECVNHMIHQVHDVSLSVEVHQFWVISAELDCMEEVLVVNEELWGQLASAKLGAIQRLEMADTLKRIKVQDDGLVDNVLCTMMEFPL